MRRFRLDADKNLFFFVLHFVDFQVTGERIRKALCDGYLAKIKTR